MFLSLTSVSRDRLGDVWLLEILGLLFGQRYLECRNGLINAIFLVHPNNRAHAFGQTPRRCNLRHANSFLFCDFLDSVSDGFIGLGLSAPNMALQERIRRLSESRAAIPRPGQRASGNGAPGDEPDARVLAVWDHLALLLAVEQVVVVLHGDKLGPAVALGDVLQRLELPRRHRRRPDVPHPPFFYDVVQRPHDLLARRRPVQSMDLQHVDVRA